ncbi:putative DNA modification/repair radical SAM protein [Acidipila sp. EB88]|uniref:putative DNA modification/repair radical SAM protein n=1 Tax=Acidipila sp. EB88 TaxID=2305226 RepID=UPI000F5FA58C|nr:putative DNA modification/repair radical SAM protein [Acidipila sp. EB88]RRA49785.1 putative DNA modification/repair radical SAM protein [Acidipila sp. EB88]
MQVQQKLEILADAAKYDASCASSGAKRSGNGTGVGHSDGMGICHSYTPDGRCVSLLKILLTNYCTYDCVFCVNRVSSDVKRARFTPQEVVDLTLSFYKRNYIEGLFLSSGIIQTPDYTMEQLITVARTLREVHSFGGYIHLKAIPGASDLLIEQAGRVADRLSANMELPTQQDLVQLAPDKKIDVIEETMSQIFEHKAEADEDRKTASSRATVKRFAPAGQSTQLVVGATPSTDQEILATASHLYGNYDLRRIYYSGFSPFPQGDARLPLRPAPLVREHRLYQADWLMRYYGFKGEELTTPEQPNLDLTQDPKLTWALAHREFFPVDVNKATREVMLRVPGIGYRNVERILRIRAYHPLSLEDLRKLNVRLKTVTPFVTTTDHTAATTLDAMHLPEAVVIPAQMQLFDAAVGASTGQI